MAIPIGKCPSKRGGARDKLARTGYHSSKVISESAISETSDGAYRSSGLSNMGFQANPPTNPRHPKLIQTRFNELFFEESLSTFYVVICQGGLTRAGAVYYFTHRLPGSFVLLKNREIPTGGESARCHRASRRVGRLARESMWRTYSASRL